MTSLDLWLYGERAARLTGSDRGVELVWTDRARERWGIGSRVLSHLLPIDHGTPHPLRVVAWLNGLLPEGRARSAMAAEHRIDPDDVLAFLSVYGRDVPGAAVFTEVGAPDPTTTAWAEPLTDDEVAAMLEHARRLNGRGPSRLDSLTSLPGTEPKIAVARTPNGWARVRDGAASTHILKLARDPASGAGELIDVEAAALDLAARAGLTTITASVTELAGTRTLVVSRYDRVTLADGTVGRLHQEDLAQALGLNTTDLERKFQHGRATPSYRDAARVLSEDGARLDDLLRRVVLTVLVGDTDAHAKNLSMLRDDDGFHVSLSPAYDVALHQHSPLTSGRLALDVAGRDRIADVSVEDLVVEAGSWGMAARRARRVVAGAIAALGDALLAADRGAHPGVPSQAWRVVDERAAELARQLAV